MLQGHRGGPAGYLILLSYFTAGHSVEGMSSEGGSECIFLGGGGIEMGRIANRRHPVSPGSEGVKGNPSPDASTDLCNGEGTIFPAVQ